MKFFLSLLILTHSSFGTTLNDTLKNLVKAGSCQREWVDDSSHHETLIQNNDYKIITVPCAQWGYNLRSLIVKITKPSINVLNSENFNVLNFRHINVNSGEMTTYNYVENYRWNPHKKILVSRNYKNGFNYCGEIVEYNFSNNDFALSKIAYQTNCKNPTNWTIKNYNEPLQEVN